MFFNGGSYIQPVNITTSGVIQASGSTPCYVPNPIPNGTYAIRSKLKASTDTTKHLYLDIPQCSNQNGDVKTWVRTNCIGQRWKFTYQGNGFYKIINAHTTGKSLDLNACGLAPGTDIIAWDVFPNDCQLWRIEAVGGGWYRIISKRSGNVLDVQGGVQTPGTDIISWQWNGTDAQLFNFDSSVYP